MARLRTSGWEVYVAATPTSGDTNALLEVGAPDGRYTGITGSCTITRDTSVKRSGAASLKVVASTGTGYNEFYHGVTALDHWYYHRVYVRIPSLPSSATVILGTPSSSYWGVLIDPSTGGAYSVYGGAASSSVCDGNWHRIEFGVKPSATQANRAWELRVDGTTVSSGTGQAADAAVYSYADVGVMQWSTTVTINFDDYAVNDDTGTFQNSWCGDGYVLVLLPTSDNARATWTGGAGGTSNLYDAVNNTPPIGTASETDLTQIEEPGSPGSISNYVANCQTPAAAGVASGDSLVAASMVICHGEDVATGSKGGYTNDWSLAKIGSVDLGTTPSWLYGDNIAALGTWPSYWRWKATSAVNVSAAARTDAVTACVGRDNTSRVASVCFLGVILEASHPSGTNWTQPVDDTLSLSDSISSFGRGIGVTDSVTPSDGIAFQNAFFRTQDDSFSLADALAFARDLHVADTLSLSDSPSAQKGLIVNLGDTVSLADAFQFDRGLALADTLSLSDALALGLGLSLSESVSLADALVRGFGLNPADTVSLSDALSREFGILPTDTVTPSDALKFDRGLGLSDSVTPSDALAFDRLLVLLDTLGLADLADPVLTPGSGTAWTRNVDDSVSLTEALAFDRGIALTENLTLADLIAFDRAMALADTLSLSDAQAFARDLAFTLTDPLSLSDAQTLSRGFGIFPADSVTLADAFLFDRLLSLGESVTLADDFKFDRLLTLSDVLSLSDLASPTTGGGTDWTRNVDDTLSLVDALAFAIGMRLTDTLSLADAQALGIGLALADTTSLSDALSREFGKWPVDSVTTSDALTFGRGLGIDDSVALPDALSFARDIHLTESVSLADSLSRGFAVNVSDPVSVADALSRGFGIAVFEAVGLGDAYKFDRAMVLVDLLDLQDALDLGHQLLDIVIVPILESVVPTEPSTQSVVSSAVSTTSVSRQGLDATIAPDRPTLESVERIDDPH